MNSTGTSILMHSEMLKNSAGWNSWDILRSTVNLWSAIHQFYGTM